MQVGFHDTGSSLTRCKVMACLLTLVAYCSCIVESHPANLGSRRRITVRAVKLACRQTMLGLLHHLPWNRI